MNAVEKLETSVATLNILKKTAVRYWVLKRPFPESLAVAETSHMASGSGSIAGLGDF